MYEVLVTEDNPNLQGSDYPPLSVWSEVFKTPGERADYVLDTIRDTEKFNEDMKRCNGKPVLVSFLTFSRQYTTAKRVDVHEYSV